MKQWTSLFMTLQGQFQMSEQDAANILFEVIEDIMNGKTLDVIIENIKDWDMQNGDQIFAMQKCGV